jgi:hypothetical protein
VTARLDVWYFDHPRLGRPALLMMWVQALAIVAVCAAPDASASTNSMVLGWTGLRDTYGVPIGNYYLAIASIRDQIMATAPDLGVDPATWAQWMSHVIAVAMGGLAAANILTAEAGLFVGIVALALWLLKLTVSTYWLTVIGEIARAIAGAVIQVTTSLGLLMLAVPIGVFAGVVTIKRGEAGRGWTMIGIALTMPAASVAIFSDPAGLMYGPDGLLAFGRRIGFSVASAATHNGALAGTGQVDTLTASLITRVVREPLQLWNFGHVVDRVGDCGTAWSAAVTRGESDGPIRAMAACGDRAAVAYAQHLDGTNIWVGSVFILAAALLAWFMIVSGWAVLRVSVMAIWTTVIILPILWLGAIPGAPQRRAADVVWQFFAHGIQTLIYIVYISVVGLAVERIVSAPLPTELGGTNPFAHVLMMGGVAIAALMLLRHIRAEVSGRRGGGGLWRQAGSVAVGMGVSAAVAGAGGAAAQGIRGLGRRSGSQGDQAPWERMDAEAGVVHGAAQVGFDSVPASGTATGADAEKFRDHADPGTDEPKSDDRRLAVDQRVAASEGIPPDAQHRGGFIPAKPARSGASGRGRQTLSGRGHEEGEATAAAPDEEPPSAPAIAESERGVGPQKCTELDADEPSRFEVEGEPPAPTPDRE